MVCLRRGVKVVKSQIDYQEYIGRNSVAAVRNVVAAAVAGASVGLGQVLYYLDTVETAFDMDLYLDYSPVDMDSVSWRCTEEIWQLHLVWVEGSVCERPRHESLKFVEFH